MRGLAAFEDGLHDIRCEKCAAEDPADISLSHAKLLCDRPKGVDFARNKSLVPDISSRDGLDQRLVGPCGALVGDAWCDDKANLRTASLQRRLDAKVKEILLVVFVRARFP